MSHKKNCCDQSFGESLCIFTFFHFPDSGLNLLTGFDFQIWSILDSVTLKTRNMFSHLILSWMVTQSVMPLVSLVNHVTQLRETAEGGIHFSWLRDTERDWTVTEQQWTPKLNKRNLYVHEVASAPHDYRSSIDQRLSIYVTGNVLSPNTLHLECQFVIG